MPVYPPLLHAANAEGEVELVVPFDSLGQAQLARARVRKSSHDLFRTATLRAVSHWHLNARARADTARSDLHIRWRFVLGTEDCPPPAYPAQRCNTTVSDTAAINAPDHTNVDSLTSTTIVGTTRACATVSRQKTCVGTTREPASTSVAV